MKKNYPKNRKGISGRPFPRATDHKLTCPFCNKEQSLLTIHHTYIKYKKDFNINMMSYTCDHCPRSLRIYRTVAGFYRIQNSLDKRKKWALELIKQQADGKTNTQKG